MTRGITFGFMLVSIIIVSLVLSSAFEGGDKVAGVINLGLLIWWLLSLSTTVEKYNLEGIL